METDWFYYSLLLLALFITSFFFSGSEVALFSLNEKQKQNISEKNQRLSKVINQLLKSPKQILITILVGNSLANVGITLTTLNLTLKIADVYQFNLDILLTIQIILLTILLLLFAEITPKIIASKYPIEFSSVAVYPLLWVETILSPITFLFNSITNIIQRKIKVNKSKIAINDDEIKALVDLGKEHGTLEVDEHNLIHSIVEYGDTTVREIMTARTDMVALNVTESFENTVKKIIESGRSRIPLYQNNLDNIIGVIHVKDLLPFIRNKNALELFSLKKLARPTLFVPEVKRIDDMLKEFQSKKIHLAIVVDEFGGTAGIVTLEDVIGEIMGKFNPSVEVEEYYKKLSDDNFLFDASIPIETLEELISTELRDKPEEESYDTLGGFILHALGDIPEVNSEFEFKGFKFIIKEIKDKRIRKVLIQKMKN